MCALIYNTNTICNVSYDNADLANPNKRHRGNRTCVEVLFTITYNHTKLLCTCICVFNFEMSKKQFIGFLFSLVHIIFRLHSIKTEMLN